MRRAASRDMNHHTVVHELRRRGFAVSDLAAVGGGCPDLLVSRDGTMRLVEIKNPATRPLKKRGATNEAKLARQAAWRALHPGLVITATSADEVDLAFGAPYAGGGWVGASLEEPRQVFRKSAGARGAPNDDGR